MRPLHPNREFGFKFNDVARLFRTYADQEARRLGMTRAQWAVLTRIQRNEGLKQSEIAEMLDLQPITLTRLLDRLCGSGLIERRPDPGDRRAWRLYLTPAARPLVDRLDALGHDLMRAVLKGISAEKIATMNQDLEIIRDNLRRGLDENSSVETSKHYG
jgi:MarR family transcriptional regulator for hemolysin